MCNIRLFTWKFRIKKLNDNYDTNKIILMKAIYTHLSGITELLYVFLNNYMKNLFSYINNS